MLNRNLLVRFTIENVRGFKTIERHCVHLILKSVEREPPNISWRNEFRTTIKKRIIKNYIFTAGLGMFLISNLVH